ncbi:hypothetical protein B5X24_HaOG210637 [Helicoverpa armigera]|nr:hypothetical protein B5X24_HaOG210637 [Helicoverpa armigera]
MKDNGCIVGVCDNFGTVKGQAYYVVYVKCEQGGAQRAALRYSIINWKEFTFMSTYFDVLLTVCEVAAEPIQCVAPNANELEFF